MDYHYKQYLVDTNWLANHLYDTNIRIIEVTAIIQRGTGNVGNNQKNIAKAQCYDKRHIPRAVFLDVASSYGPFNDPQGSFPMTWPPKTHFEKLMGDIGINNQHHVIIYASSKGQQLFNCMMWCTRAWWIMHYYGVNCSILNGNLEKWIADGYPTTEKFSQYAKTQFTVNGSINPPINGAE